MISHCTTDGRREKYISQLRKHIKVDVFGWCNKGEPQLQCDTDELLSSTPECYNMLESNYKFYLSFENSICPDYVTEKFFKIMSLRDIGPIVYGGANYAELALEHSYIDALSFEPNIGRLFEKVGRQRNTLRRISLMEGRLHRRGRYAANGPSRILQPLPQTASC